MIALILDWLPILAMYGAHCLVGNVLATCCPKCDICSDDFNRADDTDINTGSVCGWTESSGAWDISSNQLRCTTAGIALNNTAHPDTVGTMQVEVDFKHDTSGGHCCVIVNYVDASNYTFVRYEVGTNKIQISYVEGGTTRDPVDSATATMNTNTTYTAKVCSDGTNVTAYLDGTAKITLRVPNGDGTKCGLRAIGSGTATFDDFFFKKSEVSGCPTCEDVDTETGCTYCSGTPTQQYKITIAAGMANGTNCTNCVNLEGIWFCDYAFRTTGSSGACWWCTDLTSALSCGSPDSAVVAFNFQNTPGDTNNKLSVVHGPTCFSTSRGSGFKETHGPKSTCSLSAEDISLDGDTLWCDASGSSCTVDAV